MSSLDPVEAPRRRLDSAILPLALAMFGVASYLFLRALYIQYPVILADEELYALHAKFLNNPRFPIQMPNVLFFLVYHSASWFGENHLAFAKLLNAAFFAMSVLPLYAIARKFLSKPSACLFSVAVVLAPISSYSVYVMPEAMFFFAFWILTYLVVVKLPADIIYGGIYLGFALAALSAIKPHGLIIAGTFPVVVGILYFASSGEVSLGKLVEASIGCVEALVVGRFAIQYLAHGDFSVLLFGNLYQEVSKPPPVAVALKWTAQSIHQPAMVLGLGHFLWHFAQGHLAYVSVLFWPALALVVWPVESARGALEESLSYRLLRAFSLTALAFLLAMVATVGVDFASLYEVELCRLHGRYYDFLFPALLLLFLARTRRNKLATAARNAFQNYNYRRSYRCERTGLSLTFRLLRELRRLSGDPMAGFERCAPRFRDCRMYRDRHRDSFFQLDLGTHRLLRNAGGSRAAELECDFPRPDCSSGGTASRRSRRHRGT